MGDPVMRSVPAVGCSVLSTMSRAATWGCSSAASTLLMGPAGIPTRDSSSAQGNRAPGRERAFDERDQLRAVGDALWVAVEARIVDQFGQTDQGSEASPEGVVSHRHHQMSVGGAQSLIRNDARVCRAVPRRHLARREVATRKVRQPRDLAVQQRNVDPLAASRWHDGHAERQGCRSRPTSPH